MVDLKPPAQRRRLAAKDWTREIPLAAGQALEVEWANPRDVQVVEVACPDAAVASTGLGLEWWRRVWPDNGQGGWMKLDDPFNGEWTKAQTAVSREGGATRFVFLPLGTNEAPGIKQTGATHRHTYKIRLVAAKPVRLQRLRVCSDALWKTARLRFEWDLQTRVPGTWSPHFEARNGRILQTQAVGDNAAIVELEYADSARRLSADRGIVICRSGEFRSFAVYVDDVRREGGLFVRDIGAFVSDADRDLRHAQWTGPAGEVWKEGTVAEQVARTPEQSFARVREAIPAKPPAELFLGAPNLRQEIGLGPSGDIRLYGESLRAPGPDLDRRSWPWSELTWQFRSGDRPVFWGKDDRAVQRELEEGWLPVVHHRWRAGQIEFTQSGLAVPLMEEIRLLRSRQGTESLVLVMRLAMRNAGTEKQTATLWLQLNHQLPWSVLPDGTLLLREPSDGQEHPGLTAVRGRFDRAGRGQVELTSLEARPDRKGPAEALRYQVALGPGETHAVGLTVPYLELLTPGEIEALRGMSYDRAHASVVAFWKERLAQGMQYEVPDEYLYFYATSAYYHLGMREVASVLAQIQDPRAGRLAHLTEEFLRDIRLSVAESVATSPVVRLRDGTYVPFVPPRAHAMTHLKEGWIREGLYPALHLWSGQVLEENHPYVDWMIQDLEDNISSRSSRGPSATKPLPRSSSTRPWLPRRSGCGCGIRRAGPSNPPRSMVSRQRWMQGVS